MSAFFMNVLIMRQFDLPESPAPINATNGIPPDQMKMMQSMMQQMNGLQSVSSTSSTPTESHVALDGQEDGPHKNWTCVYPIYLDAKRRYRHGCRRVPYEKALLFPNSQLIANAARKLQLEYMHEVCPRLGKPKLKSSHMHTHTHSHTGNIHKIGKTQVASKCIFLMTMGPLFVPNFLQVRIRVRCPSSSHSLCRTVPPRHHRKFIATTCGWQTTATRTTCTSVQALIVYSSPKSTAADS